MDEWMEGVCVFDSDVSRVPSRVFCCRSSCSLLHWVSGAWRQPGSRPWFKRLLSLQSWWAADGWHGKSSAVRRRRSTVFWPELLIVCDWQFDCKPPVLVREETRWWVTSGGPPPSPSPQVRTQTKGTLLVLYLFDHITLYTGWKIYVFTVFYTVQVSTYIVFNPQMV